MLVDMNSLKRNLNAVSDVLTGTWQLATDNWF